MTAVFYIRSRDEQVKQKKQAQIIQNGFKLQVHTTKFQKFDSLFCITERYFPQLISFEYSISGWSNFQILNGFVIKGRLSANQTRYFMTSALT